MHSNLKVNLERVFKSSKNPDELFDAFQLVIFKKVNDPDLLKILLANPVLSNDELMMYAEKIVKDFPENSYEIFMWTAKVIENKTYQIDCQEKALKYLDRALQISPAEKEPLLKAIDLYNFDLPIALNNQIIGFVEEKVTSVFGKSDVYYKLAKLYKKLGLREKSRDCEYLAEKSAAEENQ